MPNTASEQQSHSESLTRDDLTAAALAALDPSFADLFRKARALCMTPDSPALGYLLAHCGRELSLGVIRVLEASPMPRISRDQLLDSLVAIIAHTFDLAPATERVVEVAAAIQEAFDVRPKESRFRLRVAGALSLPPTDPVVGRWVDVHDVFQKSAHVRLPSPSAAPLRQYFDELASLLYARTGPIFDTQADVDRLADLMNPTPQDVSAVRSRTIRSLQRRRFFMRAKSPEWIVPLRAAEFFKYPPDRLKNADGSWQMVAWPEGEYLLRMAPQRPDSVAEILKDVPKDCENPIVWAVVTDAVIALPPPHAGPLAKLLKTAPSIVFPVLVGHKALEAAISLAEAERDEALVVLQLLLRLKSVIIPAQEQAETLSNYAGRLRLLGTRVFAGDAWVLETLDIHDLPILLTTTLAAVEQRAPEKTARLLAGRLSEAIRIVAKTRVQLYERVKHVEFRSHQESERQASEEAAYNGEQPEQAEAGISRWLDPFSRPPIDDERESGWCENIHNTSVGDNVREALAHALFASGKRQSPDAASLESFLAILDGRGSGIFARIQMALLADSTDLSPQLAARANAFVQDEHALWPGEIGREIVGLLRAHFAKLDREVQEGLATRLRDGPSADWLTRHLAFFEREDTTEERTSAIHDWQRSRLRWFHQKLPEILLPLAEELGVVADIPTQRQQSLDETGAWRSGVTSRGAYSATEFDALTSLDAPSLIQYLASWEEVGGSADDIDRPGEGLRPALMALAAQYSERLPEWVLSLEIAVLDLAFLDGIASGIRAALTEGKRVDASAAIRLAKVLWARGIPLEEGTVSDEQRHAMTMACDLLRDVVERSTLTSGEFSVAWNFADDVLSSSAVWADEQRRPLPDGFDELQQRVWSSPAGRAMEMTLVLGWKHFESQRADDRWPWPPLVSPIEDRLKPHLDRAIAEHSTVACVAQASIGQKLGQLFWMAPYWTERNMAALMDGSDVSLVQHPAFGMYVTNHRPFGPLFTKLRSRYATFASAAALRGAIESEDRGGRVRNGVLNHTVGAVLRQIAQPGDADHIVENAFLSTTAKQRSHCYWGIYRSWSDTSADKVADLAPGLVRLWSWRLDVLANAESGPEKDEELQGMDMLVATPHLNIDEALSLTERTVAISDNRPRQFIPSWDRIARMTERDPVRGIRVVERIVRSVLAADYPYLPFDEIAPVLRAAIAARGDARTLARALINVLGERGLDDFEELWRESEIAN